MVEYVLLLVLMYTWYVRTQNVYAAINMLNCCLLLHLFVLAHPKNFYSVAIYSFTLKGHGDVWKLVSSTE